MSNLKITGLYIYPIKSLSGISLSKTKVEFRGLQFDRRWMLVDDNDEFITQRNFPLMALLQPEITPASIIVRHRGKIVQPIEFSLYEPQSKAEAVTIWEDTCLAKEVSKEASEWFSMVLGMRCRLMFMHEESIRQADQRYAIQETDKVSFADGYPVLMVSEESMDQLNQKMNLNYTIERFRPNIVCAGGEAHVEDTLRKVQINNVEFYGVKPCARCVLTTIDPLTTEQGKEPLKTLSTYRKSGNKILFGENFIPVNQGEIAIGGDINVQESKSGPFQ
jgi:uncharacterized protein YcbX